MRPVAGQGRDPPPPGPAPGRTVQQRLQQGPGAGVDARGLGLPGTGHVEHGDAVAGQPGAQGGGLHLRQHGQAGPAQLFGQLDGERGAAPGPAVHHHQGAVRVPHVPLGALGIVPARGFAEGVAVGHGPVLGPAAPGAPSAAGHAAGQGRIQGGPVHTGLPPGDDPLQPPAFRPWFRRHDPGSLLAHGCAPRPPLTVDSPSRGWGGGRITPHH